MPTTIIRADARALPLAANSVHALICDPPYGLNFMGKTWDVGAVAFNPATWTEARRVLKPGGHLAAFGGTRTFHRLACAIEDAGFEIRDSIGVLGWVYGSGFPKSHDIGKAIDKAAGVARDVVGQMPDRWTNRGSVLNFATDRPQSHVSITGPPATEAAARAHGWGTALKPAWEPIILARKPLAGTVADNVLTHGTGGLNIDGCRISTTDDRGRPPRAPNHIYSNGKGTNLTASQSDPAGRWPPNLLIIHHPDCGEGCAEGCHVAEMDRQSGHGIGKRTFRGVGLTGSAVYGSGDLSYDTVRGHDDAGGASRFFPTFRYQPKAGRAERPTIERDGRSVLHPTVKPLGLMRWLCRLLTPPGGTILDAFAGSGATLQAARLEGFDVVGVELDSDYVHLIRERLSWPVPAVQEALFD